MAWDENVIKRIEQLVNDVADEYDEFPEDVCYELNELTGNDWPGDYYLEYCAGWWESAWSLEEIVYALLNNGEFPPREINNIYAWIPGTTDMPEEEVISFFRYGKYRNDADKTNLFADIDLEGLFTEIRTEFAGWTCDERQLNKSNLYISKNISYGVQKIIHIYASYASKFIFLALRNLEDEEMNRLLNIVSEKTGCIVKE